MSLLAFALQVLPVFGLALGATVLGNMLLAVYVTKPWQLPLLLVGALLFVALLMFRKTRIREEGQAGQLARAVPDTSSHEHSISPDRDTAIQVFGVLNSGAPVSIGVARDCPLSSAHL